MSEKQIGEWMARFTLVGSKTSEPTASSQCNKQDWITGRMNAKQLTKVADVQQGEDVQKQTFMYCLTHLI